MKYYLLVELKDNAVYQVTRLATIEEGLAKYNAAKSDKINTAVYLTMIIKEIDL